MTDDSISARETLVTADEVELVAEVHEPATPPVRVVVTHPHPLHGGDMHAPVNASFWRASIAFGAAAVRFNFRGAGGSGGTHDGGVSEALDVVAAIDRLDGAGDVPLVIAGWSFGADVSLSLADGRIGAWVCAAPPLTVVPVERMAAAHSTGPKLLLVPAHDQFCPPSVASERTADWTATTVETVESTDHFFAGRVTAAAERFTRFLTEISSPS